MSHVKFSMSLALSFLVGHLLSWIQIVFFVDSLFLFFISGFVSHSIIFVDAKIFRDIKKLYCKINIFSNFRNIPGTKLYDSTAMEPVLFVECFMIRCSILMIKGLSIAQVKD